MLPLNKLLRIALPLGTATTSALITTILLSINRDDLDKKKENEDIQLNDFEDPVEEFKEKVTDEPKEQGEETLEEKDKGSSKEQTKDSDSDSETDGKEDSGKAPKITLENLAEIKVTLDGTSHEGRKGSVPSEEKGQKDSKAREEDPLASNSDLPSGPSFQEQQEEPQTGPINGKNNPSHNGVVGDPQGMLKEQATPDLRAEEEGTTKSPAESAEEREEVPLQSSDSEENVIQSADNQEQNGADTISEGLEGDEETGDIAESRSGAGDSSISDPKSETPDNKQTNAPSPEVAEGSEEGIREGNSKRYTEDAVKELEDMQEQLSGFQIKLDDLLVS